eukprot:GABV01011867.1.p1 GENE.GABV01011867.1~~GABV01011867.1.p1  ORF type:complete len:110 (-),score=26.58 GABV01011867.1:11-340(-)
MAQRSFKIEMASQNGMIFHPNQATKSIWAFERRGENDSEFGVWMRFPTWRVTPEEYARWKQQCLQDHVSIQNRKALEPMLEAKRQAVAEINIATASSTSMPLEAPNSPH